MNVYELHSHKGAVLASLFSVERGKMISKCWFLSVVNSKKKNTRTHSKVAILVYKICV